MWEIKRYGESNRQSRCKTFRGYKRCRRLRDIGKVRVVGDTRDVGDKAIEEMQDIR